MLKRTKDIEKYVQKYEDSGDTRTGVKKLLNFLGKSIQEPTPLLIKIVVFFPGCMFVPQLVRELKKFPAVDFLPVIFGIVQVILLIAIWNLKRWAVIAYVVVSAIPILTWLSYIGPDVGTLGLVIAVAFRLGVIVPAFVYWRRMSWF